MDTVIVVKTAGDTHDERKIGRTLKTLLRSISCNFCLQNELPDKRRSSYPDETGFNPKALMFETFGPYV